MVSKFIAVAVLALLASGCMPVDAGFGETHHANIERQVVDPDAEYVNDELEGGNGERAAAAVNRYQQGTVKQPTVTTNSRGAQASGSGAQAPGSGDPN